MSEQEIFIKRLSILLEETNTTQRELAEKVNVTEVTISRYLSGERKPRIEIIHKIAKYFNVSVDYLLGLTDVPYKLEYDSQLTLDQTALNKIRKKLVPEETDQEFIALYEGYKTLNETDKSILKATLDAIVNAKKGDK